MEVKPAANCAKVKPDERILAKKIRQE